MNFLRRGTEPRPYAANSTGQPRGTLRLGTQVRRVQVYEAVGEARAIFMDKLSRAIRDHLRDNHDKLQDSASFVVFSLFMVGKSPERTKPIVMLVSDDKRVRTEAFRMIKDSGIMKDFPGFDLGHMELRAEFENLRPLGSQANPTTVDLDSTPFFAPDETVDVFACEPGASGARRLAVYTQDGTISFAVAEGVVGYRGRYFLHSANHFLLPAQQAQSALTLPLPTPSDAGEDEGECEIMGLSDDEEEEDELVDITSRGSASPVESGWEGAFDGDSPPESQTLEGSLFSYGNTKGQDAHISELQPRLETPKTPTEAETPHSNTPWTKVGHVALTSSLLDSALVQIDTSLGGDMAKLRSEALPLESYHHYIETAPSDTAIKTSTPNGTIGGTLSGTPSFVRLPGSKLFQEVYIAMLDRPLVPGDCGSWVKNAITGKLFGHVIAGSPKTGLVLLMPASRLFARALDALSAYDSADGADVRKLIRFKANVEAVSAEDVTPRPQPSFLASGVDIISDHYALKIWRSTTAPLPRSGEDIHAFPTHNEEGQHHPDHMHSQVPYTHQPSSHDDELPGGGPAGYNEDPGGGAFYPPFNAQAAYIPQQFRQAGLPGVKAAGYGEAWDDGTSHPDDIVQEAYDQPSNLAGPFPPYYEGELAASEAGPSRETQPLPGPYPSIRVRISALKSKKNLNVTCYRHPDALHPVICQSVVDKIEHQAERLQHKFYVFGDAYAKKRTRLKCAEEDAYGELGSSKVVEFYIVSDLKGKFAYNMLFPASFDC